MAFSFPFARRTLVPGGKLFCGEQLPPALSSAASAARRLFRVLSQPPIESISSDPRSFSRPTNRAAAFQRQAYLLMILPTSPPTNIDATLSAVSAHAPMSPLVK